MNKLCVATLVASAIAGCGAFVATNVLAQQQVLNLYSSRHYQTDEALYANFEKATGIKVNRIDGPEDPLIERMKSEGDKSPADLLVTVDVGRLLKAQQLGLFQPISSKLLEEKIPAELRAADGSWFGFQCVRARFTTPKAAWTNPSCRTTKTTPTRSGKGKFACVPGAILITSL